MFSEKELEYLKLQRIARIATAAGSSEGSVQPDIVPVGINILKSRKYKNVLKNNKVALVIDDLKNVDPWDPRGIKSTVRLI